jgi:uncharacterized RDD family membrane protein YckC
MYHYAGFWRRVAAALIDTFVFAIVLAIFAYLLLGVQAFKTLPTSIDPQQPANAFLLAENLLPAVLTIALWVAFGGTPGKLLLSCKIIDERTGGKVGVGRAVLRYLGYFVSAIVFCLGFLWIAWDRRKQGWHDKIAGTLVIVEDAEQILRDGSHQGVRSG